MKEFTFKSQFAEFDKKAVSAQIVGSELLKLRKTKKLTPKLIVDRAKRESHPLHNCFNWDDTKAARKYRIVQANSMLRIIVEVTPTGDSVRVFTNVRVEGKSEYVPTIALLKTKDGRELILQRMQNDIAILSRRYEVYSYLADYCTELDSVSKKMVIPDIQEERQIQKSA